MCPTLAVVSGRSWANGRTIRELFAAVVSEYGDRCHICGTAGADTIDHVEPRSAGGELTSLDNLRPAHRSCNSRRGARPVRRIVQPSTSSRRWHDEP